MARNLYVTVAELQTELDAVNTDWSAAESAQLGTIIEAISRKIDEHCGQFFYQLTSTALYFTAEDGDYLKIPPLVSVTTLKTDENADRTYERTWATTDYLLMPENAATFDKPYTYLQGAPLGRYSFPRHAKGIEITGTWGWPSVPRAIREACKIEAKRTYSHSNSPSGVAASEALGTFIVEPGWHPSAKRLVDKYSRDFLVGAS